MRSEQKGCIPLEKVKQPSFSEKTLGSSISLSFILEFWANISDEDEILLNRKKRKKKKMLRDEFVRPSSQDTVHLDSQAGLHKTCSVKMKTKVNKPEILIIRSSKYTWL